MRRLPFLFGLATAVLSGCTPHSAEKQFLALDSSSAALKRSFNADRGKVRILLLVSPT
jgi:hypothetical protein